VPGRNGRGHLPVTFGRRGRSSLQQATSGGDNLRIRANPGNRREADDGSRTRDLRLGKPLDWRVPEPKESQM
jgi:hypothetical protein